MKNEWFASWFDTEYYHTLYHTRDDSEAKRFISNLMQHLHLAQGSDVLDLACGKGRHSRTLHEHGYNVLGVDLSENSILQARKMSEEGLAFQVHDMRETLPFQFDAIFNLFTSFGYFENIEENALVIKAMREMIKPDGIVLIDFMNSNKVINELVAEEHKVVDGINFFIKRHFDGSHICKEIKFEDKGEDYHFTERVQAIDFDTFKKLLEHENFEIVSKFGDHDLNEFNSDSDRLIILAKQ